MLHLRASIVFGAALAVLVSGKAVVHDVEESQPELDPSKVAALSANSRAAHPRPQSKARLSKQSPKDTPEPEGFDFGSLASMFQGMSGGAKSSSAQQGPDLSALMSAFSSMTGAPSGHSSGHSGGMDLSSIMSAFSGAGSTSSKSSSSVKSNAGGFDMSSIMTMMPLFQGMFNGGAKSPSGNSKMDMFQTFMPMFQQFAQPAQTGFAAQQPAQGFDMMKLIQFMPQIMEFGKMFKRSSFGAQSQRDGPSAKSKEKNRSRVRGFSRRQPKPQTMAKADTDEAVAEDDEEE